MKRSFCINLIFCFFCSSLCCMEKKISDDLAQDLLTAVTNNEDSTTIIHLLCQGAPTTGTDTLKRTVYHVLIENESIELLWQLVTIENARHTQLPIYAKLKTGINEQDQEGHTPIAKAIFKRQDSFKKHFWFQVIAALLSHQEFDINASCDHVQNTPLHIACNKNSDPMIVDALITAGANINAENNCKETPQDIANKSNKSAMQVILDNVYQKIKSKL